MDVNFDTAARRLGSMLRELRSERHYTLAEAAERLGISRRLLVDLEGGVGNPSLTTLLRLAEGYGMGLADLVGYAEKPRLTVRTPQEAKVLWETARGSEARLLIASQELELWHWSMAPLDERVSEPHRPGTEEIVRMLRGRLLVSAGAEVTELTGNKSALIAGDQHHSYSNPGPGEATFHLIVHEPL